MTSVDRHVGLSLNRSSRAHRVDGRRPARRAAVGAQGGDGELGHGPFAATVSSLGRRRSHGASRHRGCPRLREAARFPGSRARPRSAPNRRPQVANEATIEGDLQAGRSTFARVFRKAQSCTWVRRRTHVSSEVGAVDSARGDPARRGCTRPSRGPGSALTPPTSVATKRLPRVQRAASIGGGGVQVDLYLLRPCSPRAG